MARFRQIALASGGFCMMAVAAPGAETRHIVVEPVRGAQFVGSAGCKSSSCHGGAGDKRSQYITWSQQDFHIRAYPVLLNARSARMAETLGLGSAQASARCTVCHAPFQTVESSRLATGVRADEGVSCESCHNAAGLWLRGHTRPDWTYATRIAAGMRDLRSFYVRANSCVACHQNLDADVLAAGHPELRFELDGQSVAEPKHWHDEAGTGAKAWLVGQAVALREMSWALGNAPAPTREASAQWNGLVWLLSKVTSQQETLPMLDVRGAIATHAEFVEMEQRADALARAASTASLGDDFARNIFNALAATDSEFSNSKEPRDLLFRRAERLVMAIHRLAIAVGLESDGSSSPAYQQLIEAVQNANAFDPVAFAKALAKYREGLNSAAAGQ